MASPTTRQSRLSRLSKQQFNQDPPRAKWTAYLTKTLADLMVEQVHNGSKKNNSFDKKAWEFMCEEFNSKTGLKWDKEKLKNRYSVLRKQYVAIKSVLDLSDDFGWDADQSMVIATDEVWDEYIKAHPDAEAIRNNGCPIYNQLCTIFSESANENYDQLNDPIELDEEALFTDGLQSGAPSMFLQDEISSSTEKDMDIQQEQTKCESVIPPRSAQRKRKRTKTEEVIARAISEIASASRLRAASLMQNGDRFSITNCVHALDELQGIDDNLYYAALDLFDEPNAREMFMALKSDKRLLWLKGKLTPSFPIA